MKILFVCRDTAHASSRVRLLQYVAPLEALGHELRVLIWEPSTPSEVVKLSARAVRAGRWADVVMIGKPRLHRAAMAALQQANPRIVVDIDDAMWTWGDVFARRFDDGARRARTITAGNRYLVQVATDRYPDASVELIPAAVQLEAYAARAPHQDVRPIIVGWIGGPASLTDFTDPVAEALRRLVAAGDVRLRIVCSRPLDLPGLPAEFEPWSIDSEVASLRGFDVGIMPLGDDEAARGRCGLKAVQCMAVGVPVVASPIGAGSEIVDHGVDGLLASTEEEWAIALSELAASVALRAAMGARRRARVAEEFSVTANTPRLAAVLGALI